MQRKAENSPAKGLQDIETGETPSSSTATSFLSDGRSKDTVWTNPVQKLLQNPSRALSEVSKLLPLNSVPVLVFVWYFTAIFSITTSKAILMNYPYPYSLCLCQCFVAYTISMYISTSTKTYKALNGPSTFLVVSVGFTYTLGFILTNMAFRKVSASFAETIKASEPLTSVLLGYIFYSEFLSIKAYLTLIPICVGVATSCISSDAFSLIGFLLAIGSNFFFSSRAVLSKVLMRSYPDAMNEITLFTHISFVGVIVVLPFVCSFEALEMVNTSANNGKKRNTISCLMMCILYICNGLAYTIYNLMSFMVLTRTNIATHAVLNVFRRVFIIVFTSIYFGSHLSLLNIFGIFLSIVGVLLFNRVRENVHPLNVKQ